MIGVHDIVTVSYGYDAGIQWNISSFQSIRITFAVIAFMMMAGNISGLFEQRDIFQNLTADDGVLFCDSIFFGSQSGWLVQNRIRDTDLSYVVQMSCVFQIQNVFGTPVKFFCNQRSISATRCECPRVYSSFASTVRARVRIICRDRRSVSWRRFSSARCCLWSSIFMYITDGAKYSYKEQNNHTDTRKHTGNGHYEVDRQPFNDCRYHNSRRPIKVSLSERIVPCFIHL